MTGSEYVSVEREILKELIGVAKGKVEGDVSSHSGPDQIGYDVDEFADTIEAAESSLKSDGVEPNTTEDLPISLEDATVRFKTQRKNADGVEVVVHGSWVEISKPGKGTYWYPATDVAHIENPEYTY